MARPAPLRLPTRAPARAGAEARLALVESLLMSDDFARSAQQAVDWLGARAGVPQAVCLAAEPERSRLVGVAGYGVEPEAVGGFRADIEDREHPLVRAFLGARPVSFRDGRGPRVDTPLSRPGFTAFPIGRTADGQATGLGLLLAAVTPGAAAYADAVWVAETLSRSLARLGSPRLAAEGERRFRRERTLLYTIINAVPDPIVLTDTEGRMVVANARAEALFAARENASEGRRRAVALNNMFFSAALSRTAIDDPVRARNELLLVNPDDGSDLLFELLSAVVNDPREGTGVVSILHDVTDLRRAMQEIEDNYRRLRLAEADARAERDRLDLIIDAAADPILVTDPTGNIELMNAPAERLFTVAPGVTDPEVERRVQANDAHFAAFVASLYASPELKARGELGLVDPGTGAQLPVEAVAGQVLSDRGEVVAVVTILHDRSEAVEKAKLYEQLQRASEELKVKVREATAELAEQNELLRRQAFALEQASALKSQFLANMSHELRTPLNAILGYTSMLMQGVYGGMSDSQVRSLRRVDSNARHLLSIINDLLDIARIEAGKMPMEVQAVSVQELVDEVMTEMEPIIARSRLAVTAEADPEIPAIRTDRKKVKQVVMNFMSNALKFTPSGEVRLRAVHDAGAGRLAISVSDTGIGIAEQDFDRIFEDFRQVDDSVARRYSGTGLGLAICRRLAAMLDGRITLESRLGEGSTFTLHLPCEARVA